MNEPRFTIEEDIEIIALRYSDLVEEEQRQSVKKFTRPLWHFVCVPIGIVILLIICSTVLCATSTQCRTQVPTIAHMMNDTLVAPIVTTGFNVAGAIYSICAYGLYAYGTSFQRGAQRWAAIQLLAALFLGLSVGVTFFVYPFVGWANDWAMLAIMIASEIWMIAVVIMVKATFRERLASSRTIVRWFLAFLLISTACTIVFIVLNAITFSQQRDIGILVTQLVLGFSVVGFFITAMFHIRRVQVHIFQISK